MSNPLALTYGQKSSARNDNMIRLTKDQIVHLQTHGLLAGADETYMHPEGAFVLAPSYGIARRERLTAKGKPSEESRYCRHCNKAFAPQRPHDRFCSPVCVTKGRTRKAA